MPKPSKKPAPGEKHEDLLAGAARAFAAGGYNGTSIADIMKEAGVARRTLYLYYKGKDDLFEAIVKSQCEKMVAPLVQLQTKSADVKGTLRQVGLSVLNALLMEEAVDFYRLVVAESKRFPELGKAFYRAGSQTSIPILAKYLADQSQAGMISVRDPELAANLFFSMLTTTLRMRRLLAIDKRTSAEERADWVNDIVDFFLAACRKAELTQSPKQTRASRAD